MALATLEVVVHEMTNGWRDAIFASWIQRHRVLNMARKTRLLLLAVDS